MENTPRLELVNITKKYPAVVANDAVNLKVLPGEIHAILGENGAGKSTLMKIIYGVAKPDEGQIFWEGQAVVVSNPAFARKLGIGMVFQHFSLFETLTVAENIALAMDGERNIPALSARIEEVSEQYGLPLDPRRLVHSLTVGLRQRVEIVRCLLQKPKLLIMDEPTSVLTPQAVKKMFETLRRLSEEGCSILYISHKLDEIQELCHKATIICGGKVTGNAEPDKETASSLAKMMIGHELPVCSLPPRTFQGDNQLEVNELSSKADDRFGTDLDNVSFHVESGEILGIAGISGNGQRELMAALSGEKLAKTPENVMICGTEAGHLGPGARRDLGLGFVPEERIGCGAVPGMSITSNGLLTAHRLGMIRYGLIRNNNVSEFTAQCVCDFNVKCGHVNDPITSLSGGNLQKFITGREIIQNPALLILSQPTWGVDVGAANLIRQSIIELRNKGTAVLVVSEELDELFEICDRLVVISRGKISPSVNINDTSKEKIGLWMSGMFRGNTLQNDVNAN
ncbi:MAG: ABC transporter ATP-binding protein [Proteobacteria bacterium]|nr:ABC transporter ATP-binding protein [Pseudomonadota bacterium]